MRRIVMACMIALLLGAVFTGCVVRHGPTAQSLERAITPFGTQTQLRLRAPSTSVEGELIEVRDSTLILLMDDVVLIPFDRVLNVRLRGVVPRLSGAGARQYKRGEPGAYLRAFSRYPYGAPPDVLRAILAEHGQTEPRRLE